MIAAEERRNENFFYKSFLFLRERLCTFRTGYGCGCSFSAYLLDFPALLPEICFMYVSTLETTPGQSIEKVLGHVTGNAVKARHVGSDIMASLKTLVGGEITQYSQLMNDTRALAIERMQENAQAMGANAVIGLRFASSEIGQGLSELLAYGTAVVLRPEP